MTHIHWVTFDTGTWDPDQFDQKGFYRAGCQLKRMVNGVLLQSALNADRVASLPTWTWSPHWKVESESESWQPGRQKQRIALLCDTTPCTCTSLQGGEAIMRPPLAPACFIPIFSRGAPSGQFLAPSTLIRILQGEDAASKLHRFRKPNKARLEKCVWFNRPNTSHISQIAYYPLPRFEQG